MSKDRDFTRQAMQLLLDARTEKDEQAWWSADETGVYATGASASVETTGLAVQALLKWGEASGTAAQGAELHRLQKRCLRHLGHDTGDNHGAAGSAARDGERSRRRSRHITRFCSTASLSRQLTLTPENNDLLHQFVLQKHRPERSEGPNTVELQFEGKGGLAYQVVGSYFLPWDEKPANEPLSINVDLRSHPPCAGRHRDRHRDRQKQSAQDRQHGDGRPRHSSGIRSAQRRPAGLRRENRGPKSGRLEKFSLTATQAILYFDSIAPGERSLCMFGCARNPIRARTFQSRVYEYYDPEVSSIARPLELEVRGR